MTCLWVARCVRSEYCAVCCHGYCWPQRRGSSVPVLVVRVIEQKHARSVCAACLSVNPDTIRSLLKMHKKVKINTSHVNGFEALVDLLNQSFCLEPSRNAWSTVHAGSKARLACWGNDTPNIVFYKRFKQFLATRNICVREVVSRSGALLAISTQSVKLRVSVTF